MKITATTLARACAGLLLLYPISVILVSAVLKSENYGLQAFSSCKPVLVQLSW